MTLTEVHFFPSPGEHLCGLTWDGKYLWHSDGLENSIYQIDRQSGKITKKIKTENVRTDLTTDDSFLYQIGGKSKAIYKMQLLALSLFGIVIMVVNIFACHKLIHLCDR
ncbi:hypothetical protein J9303_15920 [Bacillaceae bacterium Marseille-Q3522]|nr:hypothetical protein [Bacillaceae bacterium Marseille-Q3522]